MRQLDKPVRNPQQHKRLRPTFLFIHKPLSPQFLTIVCNLTLHPTWGQTTLITKAVITEWFWGNGLFQTDLSKCSTYRKSVLSFFCLCVSQEDVAANTLQEISHARQPITASKIGRDNRDCGCARLVCSFSVCSCWSITGAQQFQRKSSLISVRMLLFLSNVMCSNLTVFDLQHEQRNE